MVSSCGKKLISNLIWLFLCVYSCLLKYLFKTSDENCETVESDSESIDEQNDEEENESAGESDCDDEDEDEDDHTEDDLVHLTQESFTQKDADELLNRLSILSFLLTQRNY